MESNIRTQNKESLKRAERRSKSRQNETIEQANNRKRIAAEKWQKGENWKIQNKQIIEKKNLQKKWQKGENWKLQNKQIIEKKICRKNGRKEKIGNSRTSK